MAVEVAGAGSAYEAIEDLFRGSHASFLRTAYLLLNDRRAAEEAVQDAYVSVYRAYARGRVDSAEAYMRTAVVNACRSQIRTVVRRRRRSVAVVSASNSPEDAALLAEEHREVIAALHRLPDRQRECLVLRYFLELSEADTAAALGISAGSVKTHVHRGIAALTDALEDR